MYEAPKQRNLWQINAKNIMLKSTFRVGYNAVADIMGLSSFT